MQIPHEFLRREAAALRFTLPAPGEYGVGMVFMPLDIAKRNACEQIFEQIVREEGQHVLGWRTVPVDEIAMRRDRAAGHARDASDLHRPRRRYRR